jgi:hypothetical protein
MWCLHAIYKLVRVVEVSFWFYFLPYTVLFGSYLIPYAYSHFGNVNGSEIPETRLLIDNFVSKCPANCTEQWFDEHRTCFCPSVDTSNAEVELALLKADFAGLQAAQMIAQQEQAIMNAELQAKLDALLKLMESQNTL